MKSVKAGDRTATNDGVRASIKGKNGTYGPVTGPLRLAIVLGGDAESAVGQCAKHAFAAGECVLGGGGTRIRCRTP
jgi:hypothetical protein